MRGGCGPLSDSGGGPPGSRPRWVGLGVLLICFTLRSLFVVLCVALPRWRAYDDIDMASIATRRGRHWTTEVLRALIFFL